MATKYDNDTNNHFQERWRTKQEKFPKNVDHFFLLIMSIIIFFMQCGFAFMEAGAVRYVLYYIYIYYLDFFVTSSKGAEDVIMAFTQDLFP